MVGKKPKSLAAPPKNSDKQSDYSVISYQLSDLNFK
jgi:hypothetical protein